MYRHKMDFEFNGHGIITAPPPLPAGQVKQDAVFGQVAVFRTDLVVDIPFFANGVKKYALIAKGQGCNEPVGVCYPPMVRKIELGDDSGASAFSRPVNPGSNSLQSSALNSANPGTANDLRAVLNAGFAQQEFPDVDEAFKLRMEVTGEHELKAVFDIADGYYLYREKIKFNANDHQHLFSISLPDGKIREDEYFGEVAVFNDDFFVTLAFEEKIDDLHKLIIHANYQGCALDGICYSPVSQSFDFSGLSVNTAASTESPSGTHINTGLVTGSGDKPLVRLGPKEISDGADEVVVAAMQDSGQTLPAGGGNRESLLPLLFGAFIAGILLTFTPCVLPMIPILSGIIAGQGKKLTRAKGGLLAGVYVLGTMVTYAGMGALAGATGDQLQAYFQNIWAIGLLSGLFFVMALSMFGLFDLHMPEIIQAKIRASTNNMSGSIPLVFILGLSSALIIGACVSPVVISILGIAVTSGDAVLGAQLMTTMAMAMGLPLVLLGFGAGHFIPKAGKWMDKVKQGFGVLLIGVAIYLLGLLPQVPVLLLWGGFFILLSPFLGAARPTPGKVSNWQRIERGVGIILLVWGIFLIAGGLLGQRDLFRPFPQNLLSAISGNAGIQDRSVVHKFTPVSSIEQLELQMSLARSQQKPVLIDYYADWCVDCVRMEKTTFQDPAVATLLAERYVTLQIDVTDPNDIEAKRLKQQFDVFGPPATLFFDRAGKPLIDKNFYGYMEAEKFLALISRL